MRIIVFVAQFCVSFSYFLVNQRLDWHQKHGEFTASDAVGRVQVFQELLDVRCTGGARYVDFYFDLRLFSFADRGLISTLVLVSRRCVRSTVRFLTTSWNLGVLNVGDLLIPNFGVTAINYSIAQAEIPYGLYSVLYEQAFKVSGQTGPSIIDICRVFEGRGLCPKCVYYMRPDSETRCTFHPDGFIVSDDESFIQPDKLLNNIDLKYSRENLVTTFAELRRVFRETYWEDLSRDLETAFLTGDLLDNGLYDFHAGTFRRECLAVCLTTDNLGSQCSIPSVCGPPTRFRLPLDYSFYGSTYSSILYSFKSTNHPDIFSLFDFRFTRNYVVSGFVPGDLYIGFPSCAETFSSFYCNSTVGQFIRPRDWLVLRSSNGSWAILPKICDRYMVPYGRSDVDRLPDFVINTTTDAGGNFCFLLEDVLLEGSDETFCHSFLSFHDKFLDALAFVNFSVNIFTPNYTIPDLRPIRPSLGYDSPLRKFFYTRSFADSTLCGTIYSEDANFTTTNVQFRCPLHSRTRSICVRMQDHRVSMLSSIFNSIESELLGILARVGSWIWAGLRFLFSEASLALFSGFYSVFNFVGSGEIIGFIFLFVFAFLHFRSVLHSVIFAFIVIYILSFLVLLI